jgi:hypothetical protein
MGIRFKHSSNNPGLKKINKIPCINPGGSNVDITNKHKEKKMEREKILKLLEEVLELDEETLYDKENYSIFQIVERLQEVK